MLTPSTTVNTAEIMAKISFAIEAICRRQLFNSPRCWFNRRFSFLLDSVELNEDGSFFQEAVFVNFRCDLGGKQV